MRSENSSFRTAWRLGATAAAVGLLAAGAAYGLPVTGLFPEPEPDYGCCYGRDVQVETGATRMRALGPFVETRAGPGEEEFFAVRPFYSRTVDPAGGRAASDWLWPVGRVRVMNRETDAHFAFLVHYRDFDNTDDASRYWFWFLPVYFQGRDALGEDYRAVFPLGGKLHDFLGRDSIFFVLFPLYSRTTLNDLRTWNVLWPLISETTGDDTYRFRVFPFYGVSRHGDTSVKRFVMWPFWSSAEYHEPESPGSGYVLFPLWGHVQLANQETWMVLPPFFRWSHSPKLREAHVPWPFVQTSSGEVEKFYLWPLWGWKKTAQEESRFFLWPLCASRDMERDQQDVRRRRFIPFYFAETRLASGTNDAPGEVVGRYTQVWPLGSRYQGGDLVSFRVLDLVPGYRLAPVERNWAPLWTLYTHSRQGEQVSDDALWGLFRHNRDARSTYTSIFPLVSWGGSTDNAGQVEWSLLKGLVGYRRDGGDREYRLLYFLRF